MALPDAIAAAAPVASVLIVSGLTFSEPPMEENVADAPFAAGMALNWMPTPSTGLPPLLAMAISAQPESRYPPR